MAKKAKGKRPIYLDDAHSDKLLAMVMALVGEVSVLHERLDTLERLAQAKGMVSMEEIEAYQPDEQVAQEREQWRREYIARVLRVVQEEVDSLR
ncbi:hypothetical protein [Allocoleopsis franciscana]|uniref:Uncharacterized protein n=1 Tax=Allocoleopsis franciscana PCC 7113 TaxID=1173027 RepID=K9W9N5_9CYAN|nr:hypothetical protein [Allocoleopsis franciscana]AFZ17060.1 hypothetical protein Mic7113_1169 [Allocoleopsis franciscana PCC 7113]